MVAKIEVPNHRFSRHPVTCLTLKRHSTNTFILARHEQFLLFAETHQTVNILCSPGFPSLEHLSPWLSVTPSKMRRLHSITVNIEYLSPGIPEFKFQLCSLQVVLAWMSNITSLKLFPHL